MEQQCGYLKNLIISAVLATVTAGCYYGRPEQAEKVKRLENEITLLRKQMDAVRKVDQTSVGIGKNRKGCSDEESYIILRTVLNCSRMYYAKGLQEQGFSEDDSAIWAEILAVANAYRYHNTKELGSLHEAVRGAVEGEDFRKNADPYKVLKSIRELPGKNPKDFYEVLVDTAAGEKTVISRDAQKKEQTEKGVLKSDKQESNPGTTRKKWSYNEAFKEACAAGKQYRADVDLHGMKPSQARHQAQEYSKYLSENSPAPQKALYDKINQALWTDLCF